MQIQEGNIVYLQYEVKDNQTGEMIDSNMEGSPLSFMMGKGQIIPGLEQAILGMEKGQSNTVVVEPANGYGEYDERGIQELPREQFQGIELQEGMSLYGQGENGATVQVTVRSFSDQTVTIDQNHPLAGKELLFSIMIADAREATTQEMTMGCACDAPGMEGGGCCSSGGGSGCGCH